MSDLEKKWSLLFRKVTLENVPKSRLAEEGYYLFAMPNTTEMETWQKAKLAIERQRLQTSLSTSEEIVSLCLNRQVEFDLGTKYDYHAWAKEYAGSIDSEEIRAEAYVDPAVFLRKLRQLSQRYGFTVCRDKDDEKHLDINCYWFRQPVNLYRELTKMVYSAKPMEKEISDLLREVFNNCQMLLDYYRDFARIFSQYRVFVGDHHFVASRGEHDLVPGFDYWSLLANPEKPDLIFGKGVEAVKQFLTFAQSSVKNIH